MKLTQSLVALGLAGTSIAVSADPIELNKADNRIHSRYGYTSQNIEIEALVDDLAFDKKVELHYKSDEGEWINADMSYKGEAAPGKEFWSYHVSQTVKGPYSQNKAQDLEFALRYEVNGQVFWDNNDGENYFVKAGTGEYTPRIMAVDYAYARAPYEYVYNGQSHPVNGYLNIDIIVQNIDFHKNLEVHYTYDNWATTYIGEASFNHGKMEGYSWVNYPNANNVEVWSFSARGTEAQDNQAQEVQFAVKYTVNGATYWSNNEGVNHTIPVNH